MEKTPINNTEEALWKLAKLMGIDPRRAQWKGKVAKKLELKRGNNVAQWIRNKKIPGDQIIEIENRGYPRKQWLIIEYPQDMDVVCETSSEEQYNNLRKLKRITDPGMDMGNIIRKVTHIMESDVVDIKTAMVQNVDAFYKAIFWAKGEASPEEKTEKKSNKT